MPTDNDPFPREPGDDEEADIWAREDPSVSKPKKKPPSHPEEYGCGRWLEDSPDIFEREGALERDD